MSQSENNPYEPFWILGIAMMIPLTLVSGPVAGYLLWRFVGTRFLGLTSSWMFPLMALGMAASGMHVANLIKRIQDTDSKKKKYG